MSTQSNHHHLDDSIPALPDLFGPEDPFLDQEEESALPPPPPPPPPPAAAAPVASAAYDDTGFLHESIERGDDDHFDSAIRQWMPHPVALRPDMPSAPFVPEAGESDIWEERHRLLDTRGAGAWPEDNDYDDDDHHVGGHGDQLLESSLHLDPTKTNNQRPQNPELALFGFDVAALPGSGAWRAAAKSLPPNDTLWAIAFYICCAVLLFLSAGIWFTPSPASPIADAVKSGMLLAIRDAIPVLVTVFLLSVILGALWILLLGAFVRVIVWSTVLFVPVSCVGITGWALSLLFSQPAAGASNASLAQSAFLVLVLITTISAGTVFALATYLQRDHIELTVSVLRLATNILRSNPHIFGVSLFVLGLTLVFILMWVLTVARFISLTVSLLSLISAGGGAANKDPNAAVDAWILGLQWTPTLLFFTVMLVWTTQVLAAVHSMAVTCIVHHWYFSRSSAAPLSGVERSKRALTRASTVLFGTACAGAIVSSVIHIAGLIHRVVVKQVAPRVSGPIRDQWTTAIAVLGPAGPVVTAVVGFAGKIAVPLAKAAATLVQVVNHYTMVYAAITGKGYVPSARASTRLLARSVSSAAIRDGFARAVLLLGNAILSGIIGLGIVAAMRGDRELADGGGPGAVGWDESSTRAVVVVSMWIGWAAMRFWSEVLRHVIDATFLCYAVDLDNRTCHMDEAHEAFAKFRY
ncbi:plasma-membrane choline transporter-domain-containing protein [Blastocladiella britannica]|nr:plasma-membrane choline transporter-domain-containing protein [Blastocladiella britannica]